ncbi:MAG: thiamine pyrophosphate-dependent enzyme [Proteobacteria bacterium]|nr:thiamine pyrophosphate-dependent enzyme [Pseudomonadota bacterium]
MSDHLLQTKDILQDFRIAYMSRQLSISARGEVAAGRAGFGIFGEGKEVAQVAMAKAFRPGDWRSGYYRDQTFMLATGALTAQQFFSQLYADSQLSNEPSSGGRQMNCHYASRYYQDGNWLDQTSTYNTAADVSCTAGQIARLLGLGFASKLYRHFIKSHPDRAHLVSQFSREGNEVAFGTIGDAATSEGHFWETVNAMGVLQVPVAISVWDDGYGISVPTQFQTTKGNLSEVLSGFVNTSEKSGLALYSVKGWDYPTLVQTYQRAIQHCRVHHNPCVLHIHELTQPLGHSTSGTHSRYKSAERLAWEKNHDCLDKFEQWILTHKRASQTDLQAIKEHTTHEVKQAREQAFALWQDPLKKRTQLFIKTLENTFNHLQPKDHQLLSDIVEDVFSKQKTSHLITPHLWSLLRHNTITTSTHSTKPSNQPAKDMSYSLEFSDDIHHGHTPHNLLRDLLCRLNSHNHDIDTAALLKLNTSYEEWAHSRYKSHLFTHPQHSCLSITHQPAITSSQNKPKTIEGKNIICEYFDIKLKEDPRIIILGEDVGRLGGVNLEFDGLFNTHGDHRVIDTGIREITILGQGHGAAMRGFRPIIDIQYLDYLIFCLQGMSDDIASLHYRSCGGQVSPVIIRTKGHRLMGIWHSGSPMAMILSTCQGMFLCTPRNMVQACGMYQTLLQGDDPGCVIEPMNAYRNKEIRPDNLGTYSIPLGDVEFLTTGNHLTIVTYGSCCPIALKACHLLLQQYNISVELIDCRTLMPFDRNASILRSLNKTHALLVLDEDIPGGASAYILREILETQQAFDSLDVPPRTLTAKAHRCAYGVDGDYYCKPQVQDVVTYSLEMLAQK